MKIEDIFEIKFPSNWINDGSQITKPPSIEHKSNEFENIVIDDEWNQEYELIYKSYKLEG